jgi:CDK inhibitor PHO81
MKSRMRALIEKRKTVQARLAGTLSRDSAAFIALYEGLRFFERDLSKLQVSLSVGCCY